MRLLDVLKEVFTRVIRNIVKTAESLAEKEVLVTADGEIVIREPAVERLSDKVSAVIVAGSALFFILAPIESKRAMAIGDQLMRAATRLWDGTNGEGVPEEGYAGV